MVRHSIEADTESSVSVDLKRCVCIHSLAQVRHLSIKVSGKLKVLGLSFLATK